MSRRIDEQIQYWKNRFERTGSWEDRLQWQSLMAQAEKGLEKAAKTEKRRGKYRKPLDYAHPGRKPGTYKHSEETKRKISESRKGQGKGVPKSAEYKRKMSEARRGPNNPFYGKTHPSKGKPRPEYRSEEGILKTCRPVIYNGRRYRSISEAECRSGMPAWKIKRDGQFI